jgi:hypothetical protein
MKPSLYNVAFWLRFERSASEIQVTIPYSLNQSAKIQAYVHTYTGCTIRKKVP